MIISSKQAEYFKTKRWGDGKFTLSVYPSSTPVYYDLQEAARLLNSSEAAPMSRARSADLVSAQATFLPTTHCQ